MKTKRILNIISEANEKKKDYFYRSIIKNIIDKIKISPASVLNIISVVVNEKDIAEVYLEFKKDFKELYSYFSLPLPKIMIVFDEDIAGVSGFYNPNKNIIYVAAGYKIRPSTYFDSIELEDYIDYMNELKTVFEREDIENTLFHELIHWIDSSRTNGRINRVEKEEFNSPEEFNAWFQSLAFDIDRLIEKVKLKRQFLITNFNEFLEVLEETNSLFLKQILNRLNRKYRKKFLKRLYNYWKEK